MKHLSFCFLLLFTANISFAQSIVLNKLGTQHNTHTGNSDLTQLVCLPHEELTAISNNMFENGNPNYIWIDLLKDGYVHYNDTRNHNIVIATNERFVPGDIAFPEEVVKAYIEKWKSFLEHINHPGSANDKYSLFLSFGMDTKVILRHNSDFINNVKYAQYKWGLTAPAELNMYREMIKDGLATLEDKLDYEFSQKGFYVNDVRMSDELMKKYAQYCIDEFGLNFTDGSARQARGSYDTFEHEIKKLENELASVSSKDKQ